MKIACVLLGLLTASVSASDYCLEHAPSGAVDGCSVPLIHFNYVAQFTPYCNKHDICYACGHHFQITRAQCDEKFWLGMMSSCLVNKRSFPIAIDCQPTAQTFYLAVRAAGGLFYDESNTPQYCTEPWVRQCV